MLLSIVTIHREDFGGLKRTLDSLEPHLGDPRVQWILVDGASRFHSQSDKLIMEEALEKCSAGVSEVDNGIYDAMNKGTKMASGDYVLYLNAGDELHEKFALDWLESLLERVKPGMLWGTCIERYETGEEVTIRPRRPSWTWYGMPANHQAMLFRRDLLGDEPYDSSFKITSDYALVARLVSSGKEVQVVCIPICRFYRGGLSDRQFSALVNEQQAIGSHYFNTPRLVSLIAARLKRGVRWIGKTASIRRLWRPNAR